MVLAALDALDPRLRIQRPVNNYFPHKLSTSSGQFHGEPGSCVSAGMLVLKSTL